MTADCRQTFRSLPGVLLTGMFAMTVMAASPPIAMGESNNQEILDTRDDVFSRAEFRTVRGQAALETAVDAGPGSDLDKLTSQQPRETSGGPPSPLVSLLADLVTWFAHGGAYLAIGTVVALIAVLIVQAIRAGLFTRTRERKSDFTDADDAAEEEIAPIMLPRDVALRQAEELAAAGRFREAVAILVTAVMGEVERRGLIRHRQGLTHYDYVRAAARETVASELVVSELVESEAVALELVKTDRAVVDHVVPGRRSESALASGLRRLICLYEPLGFGRRDALETHYRQSVSDFQQALGGPQR